MYVYTYVDLHVYPQRPPQGSIEARGIVAFFTEFHGHLSAKTCAMGHLALLAFVLLVL